MTTAIDSVTVIALISSVCGGAAVKIIDAVFGRPKQASEIAIAERAADAEMRAELRAEAERHRAALTKAETERDTWRSRFYEMLPGGEDNTQTKLRRVRDDSHELLRLRAEVKELQDSNEQLVSRWSSVDPPDDGE